MSEKNNISENNEKHSISSEIKSKSIEFCDVDREKAEEELSYLNSYYNITADIDHSKDGIEIKKDTNEDITLNSIMKNNKNNIADTGLSNNINALNYNNQKVSTNKDLIHIAYMMNPDKIFYNTMDDEIISKLRAQGALVTKVYIEDIYFHISNHNNNENTIYIKDQKLIIDGFLSYGYMSEFHYKAYTYICQTLNEMNIPTLHSPDVQLILNDKYLQQLRYKKHNVPIPDGNIGFSVESYKHIYKNFYKDFSVMKKVSDYGGDGVFIHTNSLNALNSAAKAYWSQQYCIFQQMIPDSIGKSIRVLCINGKATACAEYNDKTGSYKSNVNFGLENFSIDSLMKSPKLQEYFDLAEKACSSIGENLTIAGVDILDSKKKGMVVLEINMWPDIYDTQASTEVELFDTFAKAFCDKVYASKIKHKEINNKKSFDNKELKDCKVIINNKINDTNEKEGKTISPQSIISTNNSISN